MEPNANGVFESTGKESKEKETGNKVARPRCAVEKKCSRKGKSVAVRKNPVHGKNVPDPIKDFQEGIEAGLDLLSDIQFLIRGTR